MKIKRLKWLFLVPVLLCMQGCLENNLIPEFHASMDNTAEMLDYFESHGDFVNSMDCPALIEAGEISINSVSFLIIDTRTAAEFSAGHIEGAVRLDAKDIPGYLNKYETRNFAKIVLVSQSGQASAYYATLLRLLGYNNVYSLNFGMASWNSAFSDIWTSHSADSPVMKNYTNETGQRNPRTPLPRLEFRTNSANIKDKIDERITDLLMEGFDEELTPGADSVVGPSITSESLFSQQYTNNYYLVCYGSDALYSSVGMFNPYSGLGHPKGAVSYAPYSSLRGSNFLQTMPTDRPIGIYCYNGQYSAAAAAYLRALGYDAKSMLFGAHVLFYSRMLWDLLLRKYAFSRSGAVEYPYVTGD